MKSLVIIESVYKKLLAEIQQNLQNTQKKITRQKVEMSWQIGKLVEEHLLINHDETYGKNLIKRLEQDTKISRNALYKMHSFYQSYKKLPKDDPKLNWSHYRVLAGIQNESERKYLEDLTKENEWSSDLLQKKIGELKNKKPQKNQQKNKSKKSTIPKKLKATRGKLFTYKLANIQGSQQISVDLGFNVFSVLDSNFRGKGREGEIVESVKVGKKYSFKKIAISSKETHIYKAYLERVVDGDTIHVSLDLGFGIFHREILRLAKINAAELETKEGKKSFAELKKILKDQKFLIVKTNKTDIYGRYIADVFFGNKESDPQKVANEGIYLNQALLDLGAVEFVQ